MSLNVPDSIVFAPKPAAASATKVRVSSLPINGRVFGPSSQVQFSLPCGRLGAYLDPRTTFLKFKLVNNAASTGHDLKLDHSAHSAIELLEVFYGSTNLEYIRGYSALATTLIDCQGNTDRYSKAGTILEGMTDTVREGTTISKPAAANAPKIGKTFCIPLISGVIGTLAEKMLPTGAMTRDSLRVSLTLANVADIQETATASMDWELQDVQLISEYVHINETVARTIESMNPDGIRIPLTSFSLQSNTVPKDAKSCSLLLSGNFRSVKTILTIFRLTYNKGTDGEKWASARINPIKDDGRWSYDIGGIRVPQREVVGDVETYKMLELAFHAYSPAEAHGIHTLTEWTGDANNEGGFLIGVDLDAYGGKSLLSESGTDVSTSSCYFNAEFAQTYTPTGPITVDSFFHYDGVLYITPDGSSARMLV